MQSNNDLKVLILEDEPLIALNVQEILEDIGFRDITMCYRLDAAEAATVDTRFDLALLDINVERNRTSLALAERIGKTGTRVVFASGNSQDIPEIEGVTSVFVHKPYGIVEIETAVRDVLDRTDG